MCNLTKEEIKEKRFQFGENWKAFLNTLNKERIHFSKKDLLDFLEEKDLTGKTFLDVGSGSVLSSLVAKMAGASVHSFDYDINSVACTGHLKEKYFPEDQNWIIEQGSALSEKYIERLGKYDIVYSWGVLHHTGNMYKALELVEKKVADKGKLFISLYNDQGPTSKAWLAIKKAYVNSPFLGQQLILFLCYLRLWDPTTIKDNLKGRPFYTWRNYGQSRGMSLQRDIKDWVGGYPFEVSKPKGIIHFFIRKGYNLKSSKLVEEGKGVMNFYLKKTSRYHSSNTSWWIRD